jgi:DNA-binding MarR family transcriptional regulator
LTDPNHDRFSAERAAAKSVTLTGRDLNDARRLFGLLSEVEEPGDGSSLARALYERLRSEGGILEQKARQILAIRQRRTNFFAKAMFGEPAWDILLVLYTAGEGLTMNRLAQLSGVSQATGLRWMNYLSDQKLIRLESHPTDARSLRVLLTEKGREALDTYLASAVELGGS